jgi:hypothetical protein
MPWSSAARRQRRAPPFRRRRRGRGRGRDSATASDRVPEGGRSTGRDRRSPVGSRPRGNERSRGPHRPRRRGPLPELKIMLLTAWVMVRGDRRNEALIAAALAEKHGYPERKYLPPHLTAPGVTSQARVRSHLPKGRSAGWRRVFVRGYSHPVCPPGTTVGRFSNTLSAFRKLRTSMSALLSTSLNSRHIATPKPSSIDRHVEEFLHWEEQHPSSPGGVTHRADRIPPGACRRQAWDRGRPTKLPSFTRHPARKFYSGLQGSMITSGSSRVAAFSSI